MKELLGSGTPRRAKQYDVSVIICCAGTAEHLKSTLQRVNRFFEKAKCSGEVLVADDGSIPESESIVGKAAATKVSVGSNGFGAGVAAAAADARGKNLLIGVADGRYDFMEGGKFLEKLAEGYDFVQGCRMPEGGGNIRPDAISVTRRWVINPLCSRIVRRWFGHDLNDPCSRMMAVSRKHYNSMVLRCADSEFNVEILLKSCLSGAKVTEVPITLHQVENGKKPSEIRSIIHGRGTLMLFFAAAPLGWLVVPGIVLLCLGLTMMVLTYLGISIAGSKLNIHGMLVSGLVCVAGWQVYLSSLMTSLAASRKGIIPIIEKTEKVIGWFSDKRGRVLGGVLILLGVGLLAFAFAGKQGITGADYHVAMKHSIPGIMLVIMGVQTVLYSGLFRLLGIKTK
ncbi:hypothetical protein BVX97_01320 [bacterium E08(2017)]|nr:hypothetical protein BVX97_01320 [bacterium E08(2017)]